MTPDEMFEKWWDTVGRDEAIVGKRIKDVAHHAFLAALPQWISVKHEDSWNRRNDSAPEPIAEKPNLPYTGQGGQ
jgi:hypothetical protein